MKKLLTTSTSKTLSSTMLPLTLDFPARKRNDYNEHCEWIEERSCVKQHLFIYKPNSTEIMCREYLCDCFECLQLNFDNCCTSNQLDDIENTNTEEGSWMISKTQTQKKNLTIKLKLKIMIDIS